MIRYTPESRAVLDCYLLVIEDDEIVGHEEIECEIVYRQVDPYRIELNFDTSAGRITWTVLRIMLQDGVSMADSSDEWEAEIAPYDGEAFDVPMACFSVGSVEGVADMLFTRLSLQAVYERTLACVPLGQESEFQVTTDYLS